MQYPTSSESAGQPQPLIWWSQAQMEQLAALLQLLWAGWVRDWLVAVEADQVAVRCRHTSPADAASAWSPLGCRRGAAAWTDGAAELRPFALSAAGAHAGETGGSSPVARAINRQSQARWLDLLGERLQLEPAAEHGLPPLALFKPWSGAVALSFEIRGRAVQHVLLDPAAAGRLLGAGPAATVGTAAVPRGGLVPVLSALGRRPIRLRVELEACEIDLGSLCGITVGDVVPLPHPLELPLALSCDGARVCTAYLGRKGKSLAVELTSETAAAAATEPHQA